MNDAVNVRVLSEHLVEAGGVGDVDLDKLGLLARDQFNAVDDLWGRVVQVVGNDDLVVSFQESEGREGANVARSSVVVCLACCGRIVMRSSVPTHPVTRTVPTTIFAIGPI